MIFFFLGKKIFILLQSKSNNNVQLNLGESIMTTLFQPADGRCLEMWERSSAPYNLSGPRYLAMP